MAWPSLLKTSAQAQEGALHHRFTPVAGGTGVDALAPSCHFKLG
ncbi:MAG TPA: hypothetical protein VL349_12965 [Terriglobales bacterium]|jgi:hypothetical protein|nr:hypothetical protein [Terriglobales bacterium]